MHRFEVYSGSVLVGWTELERGDPPMGCADGRLFPSAAYNEIQHSVIGVSEADQAHLQLSVRLADGGETLEPVGGVGLIDVSAELGDAEGLCVCVYGVAHPRYAQLFPQHVAAYEHLFNHGA